MKEELIKEFEANFWEIPDLQKKMLMEQSVMQVVSKLNEWSDWLSIGGKLIY